MFRTHQTVSTAFASYSYACTAGVHFIRQLHLYLHISALRILKFGSARLFRMQYWYSRQPFTDDLSYSSTTTLKVRQ